MIRRLVAALLLVACGSAVPVAEPPELDTTAHAASVVLMRGARPKCGAVAVGPSSLVTALHCLEGAQSVQYVDRSAWRLGWVEDTATLARSAPGTDLALLATSEPLDAWSAPSFESLSDGQSVCWSHHGGNAPYQWDCGTVLDADHWAEHRASRGRVPELLHVVETDLFGGYADSGSALWDQWGRLVGVCVGDRDDNDHAVYHRGDSIVALLRNETERTP